MVIKHGRRFFGIPPVERYKHTLPLNLDMPVSISSKRHMRCSVTSKIVDKSPCILLEHVLTLSCHVKYSINPRPPDRKEAQAT